MAALLYDDCFMTTAEATPLLHRINRWWSQPNPLPIVEATQPPKSNRRSQSGGRLEGSAPVGRANW